MNVRILREDPNSSNRSVQTVSIATVSEETALLFEDYRKGRKTMERCIEKIDDLSVDNTVSAPFSVYLNVHDMHASVIFVQSDLMNRDVQPETMKLAEMNRGLRVFFSDNSFQVINPIPTRRVDLFTKDGQEYKIEMNGDYLKSGKYTMFKCYEVVGISDYDIEWAYLMAAQEWYDTAANNCLTYSKRIIRQIHSQIMGSNLDSIEEKKLNKLYISVPGEASFEKFRSRISFFLTPGLQPFVVIIVVAVIVCLYVELRLRYQ